MRKLTIACVALALLACEPADTETDAEAASEVAVSEETEAAAAASPVGVLGVDTVSAGGEYLTDAGGRALYTLEDEDDPDACVDACAAAWPPYTRTATDELAPTLANVGLQPELLGSVERPDGTSQVTYDGHPLYFYAQDRAPGETRGHDVTDQWGEWYLVQPSGELAHD